MAKKTLGKYEITDRLGRGGMAEVYRAYHPSLDRYVAIKLLHPFLADDTEFKERFEGEARNIARLRHPHIVQVFDFDFDDVGESYYMVMELIEGPTLKDVLFDLASTGQQMDFGRAIEIAKESAQALAYAHQNGMIHRDVKPANLMVENADGRLVLTDFGIAKIVTGTQFTASGGMIGTPAYMSPEQGMGESGDERSDLYSLGVIFYQMVTGRLPYDAETPLAIILKHLNEPLPLPSSVNPEVPEWLEAVVVKTLEKEPDDRFPSANELIAALDAGPDGPGLVATSKMGDDSTFVPKATGILKRTTQTLMPDSDIISRGNLVSIVTSMLVIAGVIAMIAIVLGQGGRGPLAGVFATDQPTVVAIIPSDTPTITPTNTPTNTLTSTPTPTNTLTSTPTPTNTLTSTPTLTNTATLTFTLTATSTLTHTLTPTNTLTSTLTPSNTLTPTLTPSSTLTPTIDVTTTLQAETLLAITAATATIQAQVDHFATRDAITPTLDIQRVLESCDLEYSIISPEDLAVPPSVNRPHPRLIQNEQPWELDIEILNTSTCDWPAGFVFLSFVDNAESDLSEYDDACTDARTFVDINLTQSELANIRIEKAVPQVEQVVISLDAVVGERFGCYFSTWELRIPDFDLFIGDPFVIGYRGFGGQ